MIHTVRELSLLGSLRKALASSSDPQPRPHSSLLRLNFHAVLTRPTTPQCPTTSVHVTATASETAAASHAKTATAKEEAHPANGATDRAAHDGNVVADATTPATDQDHPSVAMTARKTAHVSHEDEAAATAVKTEARATHHEVPAAA